MAADETDFRPDAGAMLAARGLRKIYSDGKVVALDGVSFEIDPGQFVAVMGRSGCGKSTLLNLMAGLDRPSSGEIWVAGQALSKIANLDGFRARTIGIVFQSFHLIATLSALENVQVPMFGVERSPRRRRRRAEELLEAVGMTHRARHRPAMLSVGERQRIAVARSLANSPDILLADEPTGNLDSRTEEEILDLLDNLQRDLEMTLVVVTHSDAVAERAERVIRLQDGRIASDEHRRRTRSSLRVHVGDR